MQELDDIALLRDYAENGSEAAFAKLVERHVDRVYSVALRHTGNPHQAEEITQAVFVILAKKARGLRKSVILEGWLYQTARLTAVTQIRSEIRRSRREQKASMQTIPEENENDAWSQMAPLLDGALAGLNETDRNAVVLRFFYGKSMREIGTALGASEDSARMRINRALEKLRDYFLRHGVASTAAIIAGAMSANSVQAAPVALAKLATAAALAKGATGSVSAVTAAKGVLKIMAWTKVQTAIVGAVIVGMAAYSVVEHQGRARLREQNEVLQRQVAGLQTESQRLANRSHPVAPHLPAPAVVNASAASPAEDLPTTNLFYRFRENTPSLTAAQVDAFLQKNGRKASALLAAYRTSHDVGLLREAMGKFPNDPAVAYEAVASPYLTVEEKRPWLAAFQQAAPDNALANYLSAKDFFDSGQIDKAVQALSGAAGKSLDDYSQSRIVDDNEAYLSAGYSPAESEIIATQSLLLTELSPLKQLGLRMVDLANAYNQSGDPASAQAVLQMAMNLGKSLQSAQSSSPALISQLVGMAIQNKALGAMDPNSVYGENGQTVQDMLNQIAQNKATISALDTQAEPLMKNLTDQELIDFTNRRMLFGEVAAMQWVVNTYGQQ
jgi:RNA polymerase sigma factor (sigma-70 family)